MVVEAWSSWMTGARRGSDMWSRPSLAFPSAPLKALYAVCAGSQHKRGMQRSSACLMIKMHLSILGRSLPPSLYAATTPPPRAMTIPKIVHVFVLN